VGVAPACLALGVSRATLYRQRSLPTPSARKGRPKPQRSLPVAEQQQVLAWLNSERFMDCSVAEVYATLLDEGTYLCSIRTMYQTEVGAHGETQQRRQQHQHPTAIISSNSIFRYKYCQGGNSLL
jgi:putative transposase